MYQKLWALIIFRWVLRAQVGFSPECQLAVAPRFGKVRDSKGKGEKT